MMEIEIKLPEIGDGIESGDVLEVLVQEGDELSKDQDLVELETDKATMGVPCPQAGTVVKIHVSEGDTVAVGATLVTLSTVEAPSEGEKQPASPAESSPAETELESASEAPPEPADSSSPASIQPAKTKQSSPRPAAPVATASTSIETTESLGDVSAGPAIRRLAREVGIDLRGVQGSGKAGRITREDVMSAVRSVSQGQSEPNGESEHDSWGPIHFAKVSKIRKLIASKMHESWSTVPRVTNFDDADITELEEFRQDSKQDYATKGIKLTAMPFVIKAVVMSLQAHPEINASLDLEQGHIIYKDYVNIGIAVDTERGLVVPSLRSADKLSISESAHALSELTEKVRGGRFSPDELRGSTFTISNLGSVGGSYSTPIINVPEVAILLLGRSRKMPVVIDNEVCIRLMMPLSLSYDHRLVDGAMAGRFLNDVIGYLQAPSRLLLAP
jgi:pyruvate dehydrogenase E2 component (dihydrolipoamide acetyltransferase)